MEYDIAIIGGGIHGVGVAREAAKQGFSVVLLEKDGIASGTSGRSSKLIHGGLRYLETGEFDLVRECLLEREWLLKTVPDLVKLVPVYFPIYKNSQRSSLYVLAGLALYSFLAGFGKGSNFHTVPRREWANLEGLSINGLQKVYQYFEAQTDDVLLSKWIADDAEKRGAEVKVLAEFLKGTWENNNWNIEYQENEAIKTLHAKKMVNASGPWANIALERIIPEQKPVEVDLVRGSHILLSGNIKQGIYYLEAPQDGRAVFVMPWKGNVLVGTTETDFKGDPTDVEPLEEEKAYLLATVQHYFPEIGEDIINSFAGLRVLPKGSEGFFHRSRETLLHSWREGKLVTIYGGKLTAFHATAKKVLDILI